MDDLLVSLNWTKDKLPQRKVEVPVNEQNSVVEPKPSTSHNCTQSAESQRSSADLNALAEICLTINRKRSASDTPIDLFKLKRDLKRRRMKYRTTKLAPLSYTEELRELIDLQMSLLQENTK